MKTLKELTEKINQVRGFICFNTGYLNSSIRLFDLNGDIRKTFISKKKLSEYQLQEIEADLIAQVNESEIVEKMIYESKTK